MPIILINKTHLWELRWNVGHTLLGCERGRQGVSAPLPQGEHTTTSLLEYFLPEVLQHSHEYNLFPERQCEVADCDWGICFRYTATHKHTPVESLNPIYWQMKKNLNNFVLCFSSSWHSTIEHALGFSAAWVLFRAEDLQAVVIISLISRWMHSGCWYHRLQESTAIIVIAYAWRASSLNKRSLILRTDRSNKIGFLSLWYCRTAKE